MLITSLVDYWNNKIGVIKANKNKKVELILHEKGKAKFVLLEDRKSLILASDPTVEFHQEILLKVSKKHGRVFKCLGGGRIDIEDNSINVYGQSLMYGQAPTDIVKHILESKIEDKNILIELGVGY